MSDIYFMINAIEKIDRKELRVYGVEKGKGEQQNYQETAQAVERKKVAQTEETAGGMIEYGEIMQKASQRHASDIYGEMARSKGSTIENRQQQLAFEKNMQGSRARTMRAVSAYESNFMVY